MALPLREEVTHPSKRKGNTFEREVVNYLHARGHEAKRAYASNGEALGVHESVDIMAKITEIQLCIQAKRRKSVANWLICNEHQDAVVFRADGKEAYISLPLTVFLDILEQNRGK